MRSRSQPGRARRRVALVAVSAVLAAGAGCGRLAPDGITPGGALIAPPVGAEVAALAASMSAEGREWFFSMRPKVLDRSEMALECSDDEASAVLGCYGDGRIFILRVTRPELAGIMEVTAAHEMLHAVYDHLSPSERIRVERLVDDQFRSADGPALQEALAAYEGLDPKDRLDELHSILGTEAAALSPGLADHYARYFTSRQRLVDANDRFDGVFTALERQIDALIAQTDALEAPLQALDARLTAEEAAIDALDRRLDDLQAAGDVAGFNRLLPERARLARSLDQEVDRYNKMVDDYNAKVDQIDALALKEEELVDAIDEKPPAEP